MNKFRKFLLFLLCAISSQGILPSDRQCMQQVISARMERDPMQPTASTAGQAENRYTIPSRKGYQESRYTIPSKNSYGAQSTQSNYQTFPTHTYTPLAPAQAVPPKECCECCPTSTEPICATKIMLHCMFPWKY